MFKHTMMIGAAFAAFSWASVAVAGPVFLTGHDPDFHAQVQQSGKNQLTVALNFVTNGTYNDGTTKFLWVESYNAADGAHLVGFNGLAAIGVGSGNVDRADAAQFALVNLADYSAIVVASTFGGMLTDAEINALITRKTDIANFVNAGGGLAAFAECGFGFADCNTSNVLSTTQLYGFVPVGAVAASTSPPYTLTPYGLSLGLTSTDVNDCCTHNSFGGSAGLNIVDTDRNGNPTTLAGIVRIGDGGFNGVPEPATWAMMLVGFSAAGSMIRRRRKAMLPT